MSEFSLDAEDQARPLARLLNQMSLLVFFIVVVAGLTAILGVSVNQRGQINLSIGDRSARNVEAPRSINYTSDVLTRQEQERVVAGIYEYTPLDRNVGREQANQAQAVFRFTEVVRSDSLASRETQLEYIQSIENLEITIETAELLINLSQEDFIEARNETLSQISSVMLQTIRPEQLAVAKRDARSQISFDLNPQQEQIASILAPQFIVPNVFLNEQETNRARQNAVLAVIPIQQVITEGQPIIRVGDIVQAKDIEALEKLGMLQQEGIDWYRISSAFLVSTLTGLLLMIYWWRFMDRDRYPTRHLLILLSLILIFTAGARVALYYDLLYLFPAAGLAMLLTIILNPRISLIVTFVISILVGYMAGGTLEPVMYFAVGSLIAAMTLRDRHRFGSYFRAGTFGVVGNLGVILLFHLTSTMALGEISVDLLLGITNGLIISPIVTIGGFFLVGLFGVITVVQLQDLSRLDHPLLQELLRKAPGTYHHSIMVANLAEQAAERIDANGTLVRVGAFYHDIGKMDRPEFFSENQAGRNMHDTISPYASAEIILAHVTNGLEKAKKARLPLQIQNFIAEHHGRGVLRVFYEKAKLLAGEDADDVDINLFRYIGPRPRSRETAIVLLADTIEAAATAIRPETVQDIEKLVIKLVDDHVKAGQLDRSDLTMGDLSEIRESFIETLKGRYHLRVKYPGNNELLPPSSETNALGESTNQNGTSNPPQSVSESTQSTPSKSI
ncbi:MAG: putative nucleotidyltransferase with HDIG domain [Cellvibrionaceae bacterium]|jgi:putative nucleotidyltransferase with HDIG domain